MVDRGKILGPPGLDFAKLEYLGVGVVFSNPHPQPGVAGSLATRARTGVVARRFPSSSGTARSACVSPLGHEQDGQFWRFSGPESFFTEALNPGGREIKVKKGAQPPRAGATKPPAGPPPSGGWRPEPAGVSAAWRGAGLPSLVGAGARSPLTRPLGPAGSAGEGSPDPRPPAAFRTRPRPARGSPSLARRDLSYFVRPGRRRKVGYRPRPGADGRPGVG